LSKTLHDKLVFTTTQLGESYAAWKEEEKNKEEDRKAFFELALEHLRDDDKLELRTKVVEVVLAVASLELAQQKAERRHPRFRVQGVQKVAEADDGSAHHYKVVLQENPEFVSFTFINEHDERVYQRRVDDGPLRIDEDEFEEQNPSLYLSLCKETWGGKLVICPLDLMTPAVRQSVAEYIYPGPPKVVLAPPRAIKPEDLE
jgi:hypothetical protein